MENYRTLNYVIGIDALNIRAGGGLKYLQELLNTNIDFSKFGIAGVIVFISTGTQLYASNPSIKTIIIPRKLNPILNYWYQRKTLNRYLKEKKCDILFCPGGSHPGRLVPFVSMSQNMLVFEKKERNRFPLGLTRLRYIILEIVQSKSLKNSSGNIFISNYARSYISKIYPSIARINQCTIYLGASTKFKTAPKKQYDIANYSFDSPLKLTYISIVNHYKHQNKVINAVEILRSQGYPVELILVGGVVQSLERELATWLSGREGFIVYKGNVAYSEIENIYKNSDVFIFASSCENMPNILVEAMSAGLPIACSSYGPMPEILKDGGEYFDPLNINSIVIALKNLIDNAQLRQKLALKASMYSNDFSWEKCASETFRFISEVAAKNLISE